MFIELVEALRCVRDHDESWLVASIEVMRDRSIVTGTLGCPVCGAEYPLAGGVADFSDGHAISVGAATGEKEVDLAERAGAFLGLAEAPDALVVLGGNWSRGAKMLTGATGARAVGVNAPAGIAGSPLVALVLCGQRFPLGKSSCAGVALDESFGEAAMESAVACLKPGGRIVAPTGIDSPRSVNILTRDPRYWIGEKAAEVTPLRRASR